MGMEEMRRLWQEKARSYLYMRGYAAILARFMKFQARLEKLEVKEIRKEERGRAHEEVLQKLSGVYCVNELSYAKILKNERVMYPSSSRLKKFLSPRRYHFSLLPRIISRFWFFRITFGELLFFPSQPLLHLLH